jgi:anti-anti-sigma factor
MSRRHNGTVVIRTWPLDRTTTVVDVRGSLGAESGRALVDSVCAAIEPGRPDVVLNLSGVSRLDAAGLGQLAASVRAIRAAGGTPKAIVPDDDIRELLARTHLLELLQVLDGEAAPTVPSADR